MSQVNQTPRSHVCPRCGSKVERVHRRPLDRVRSIFVPLRRYRCTNCGWTDVWRHSSRSNRNPNLKSLVQKRRVVALVVVLVLGLAAGLLITQVILPQLNARNRRTNSVWPNAYSRQVAVFDSEYMRSITSL